jgi:D-psicose/D-tagatose/L-ribulose 3-epimerase
MRKIGIEIFYWIDNWADDQIAYFAKARECGFDAVEISFVSGPETIDVARMRQELDSLGLEVFCSTGLSPSTDITSPDKSVTKAGIAYLRQCLETAQKIGSPILGGVTYAPWLYFPESETLQTYRDRSATALREVAQIADDLGITLTVEIL